MLTLLSFTSLSLSLSLSHSTTKILSTLPKNERHNREIRQKLEIDSKRFDHRSTENQILFSDLLTEIEQNKKKHGLVYSPFLSKEKQREIITEFKENSKKKTVTAKETKPLSLTNIETEVNEKSHLRSRSLMKNNNFIELSAYSDTGCMNKIRSVGRVVNYCYNQYGGSYLLKVNRKENIVAQIEYDEQNCAGIPSKVTDLQYLTNTGTSEFSECLNGVKWSYLSDYPIFGSSIAGYGSTYSNADVCDDSTKNYYGYDFRAANVCVRVALQNGVYLKANVMGCEESNSSVSNYYFDSLCSGSVAYSTVIVQGVCEYPSWWDGDDQDDFKQGSSNYVVDEVHTDYCYDPTHSKESPPTVEGTCETSFFNWVGDGFCDTETNTPGCNYDGGDCCKETCVSTVYDCGSVPYNCTNPSYS